MSKYSGTRTELSDHPASSSLLTSSGPHGVTLLHDILSEEIEERENTTVSSLSMSASKKCIEPLEKILVMRAD